MSAPSPFLRPLWVPILSLCWLLAGVGGASPLRGSEPLLKLKPGDHVAIIGNALADRMQHTGYFETLVQARFAEHDLVFRNLAVAGDEVVTRHRSGNFGSPDDWLRKVGADVVLAFFGFNESFRGLDGLESFRRDLAAFIQHTLSQDYSGRGAPRLVLFSPVAVERHRDPDFPEDGARNAILAAYAEAMREVAAARGVAFVDLYEASLRSYAVAAAEGRALTVNGLHLTEAGDAALAPILFESLFREAPSTADLSRLRAAVNEKNWQWHQRYRTIDGYNVYGGRSQLNYESGPGGPRLSNYHVMQQEMSQRDVLTANRDRRVWAAARGNDLPVDDSNLPPVTAVKSNKPGPGPEGAHSFLGGEAALGAMTVHSGMKANLFASEEQFPELVNPVQMAWDTRGRLWVATWPNYPERRPDSRTGDRLLVFEDRDRDGRADSCRPFLEDLNAPTGFQFYKDGVLVVQAPDLWWVRDTDGDGRGDWKERVLMGLDSADSHHTANALCLDPGGAVYLSDGVFHRTQVETAEGPVRNHDAAIYRFVPRTGGFETHIAYGFANPHGRVFDAWGNDLVTDATGNENFFGPAFSGRLDYPAKHAGMRQFWNRPSRPCAGTGLLSSGHFPPEFQGDFLNCNVISFQGIYRVGMNEEGSGLKGDTLEPLVQSQDPNFRPVAVGNGPDGALYFLDWHNPIIGHMQHHLRDPSRDHAHGRIYRITWTGRPLLTPPVIAGQPIPALLELLKAPENLTRELAKIELDCHPSTDVIPAVKRWAEALDPQDPAYAHHLTEALWVHQWHNRVDLDLLNRVLALPDHRARAAATRVLCYWRDRVPDALPLLLARAADPHPRARLEAVRAASFFRGPEAVSVALRVLQQPTDYYLDYTLNETLRQLESSWRRALKLGEPLAGNDPVAVSFLLQRLTSPELLELPGSAPVEQAILGRADLVDGTRNEALRRLAGRAGETPAAALMGLIETLTNASPAGVTYSRLLPLQPPSDLRSLDARLAALAKTGPDAALRQAAWAARIVAEGDCQKTWTDAASEASRLADLLNGLPLVYDADLRSAPYDRASALLRTRSPDFLKAASMRALVTMPRDPELTFKLLAETMADEGQCLAGAQGLRVLPRSSWSAEPAAAAAKALVAWARRVPVAERTGRDYVEAVQVADELAGFLPEAEGAILRRELRELRVAVFVVRTVREQMRFDTPRLVVEAGKPFEIMVENPDFMPHNFVVVKPGSRPHVGSKAQEMKPDQRDREGRPYVPESSDVLGATRLLEAGQTQRLKMTAPTTEGDHEFVCTFPDHWQTMWGWLVVTRDVEGYLRQHPVAPPAGVSGTVPMHAGHGDPTGHAAGHGH